MFGGMWVLVMSGEERIGIKGMRYGLKSKVEATQDILLLGLHIPVLIFVPLSYRSSHDTDTRTTFHHSDLLRIRA